MKLEFVFHEYDPADEPRRESLFSLSSGVLLVRACPCWETTRGEHYPGTYHAGVYDPVDAHVEGQHLDFDSIVNLPNWQFLTFRNTGEANWFHLSSDRLLDYTHRLDAARGIVCRELVYRDSRSRRTRVTEWRLVSMASPTLAALRLELTPLNWKGGFEFRSAIIGDIVNGRSEREQGFDGRHLELIEERQLDPEISVLSAKTLRSSIPVSLATRTRPSGPDQNGGVTVEKVAAILTDPNASRAVEQVRHAPKFQELAAAHAGAWQELNARVAIRASDTALQQTVRLNGFAILQTATRQSAAIGAGIASRGLQESYYGHVFWDEIFVFPFLLFRFPELVRAALLYRWRRLDAARNAARREGVSGALFPWRSARSGEEETPRLERNPLTGGWMPDRTSRQFHINAAIAYSVWHYVTVSGDENFLTEYGAEMLIEIARFWASYARFDSLCGRYRIQRVVGPDEYHEGYPERDALGIDDNAYTNVMAAWSLRCARDALRLLPDPARNRISSRLRLGVEEIGLWERVSRKLRVVFFEDGVIAQFDGFGRLRPFDPRVLETGQRADWFYDARGDSVGGYQVVKQADTMMLLYLLPAEELRDLLSEMGYEITEQQLRRTAQYYLARTAHQSSLSRVIWAGALARLDPAVSWDLFCQARRVDWQESSSSSTSEGLHLGAMGALTDVVQRHYLGLRVERNRIVLDPAVPDSLGAMQLDLKCRFGAFTLEWTGSELRLRSDARNSGAVLIAHHDAVARLKPGQVFSTAAT